MVVLLVLLSSFIVVAEDDCGFWCKVNKFFWGDAENRAGKSWFERGVVGKVTELPPAAQANIDELDRASWKENDRQGREYYQGPAGDGWTYYRVTDSGSGNYYIYKEYTVIDPATNYIPLPDFVGVKIGTEPFQTDKQLLAEIEHPLQDSASLIYGTAWNERERAGVINVEVLTSAEFPPSEDDIEVAELPPTSASPTTMVAGREGPATREEILGMEGVASLPESGVEESPSVERYIATPISGSRQAVYDTEDGIWRYGTESSDTPVTDPSDLGAARVQLAQEGRLPPQEIGKMSALEWRRAATSRRENYASLSSDQENTLREDDFTDEDIGNLRQGYVVSKDDTKYIATREEMLIRREGPTVEQWAGGGWSSNPELMEAVAQGVIFGPELTEERLARDSVTETIAWASLGGTPSYINNEVHVGEEEYYEEDSIWYRNRDYWFDEEMDDTTSQQLAEYRENKQWEMVAEQTENNNVALVSSSWIEQGITDPEEALAWVDAGVVNPESAKELKDRRLNPTDEAVAAYDQNYGGEEKLARGLIADDTGSAGDDNIFPNTEDTLRVTADGTPINIDTTIATSSTTYELTDAQRSSIIGGVSLDNLKKDGIAQDPAGGVYYFSGDGSLLHRRNDKVMSVISKTGVVSEIYLALQDKEGDIWIQQTDGSYKLTKGEGYVIANLELDGDLKVVSVEAIDKIDVGDFVLVRGSGSEDATGERSIPPAPTTPLPNLKIHLVQVDNKVQESPGITTTVNPDNSVELLYIYNQNKALRADEAILTTTPQVIIRPNDYTVTATSKGKETQLVLVIEANGEKRYYAENDVDSEGKPLAGKTRYLMTADTALKIETVAKELTVILTPKVASTPPPPTTPTSSLQTNIDAIVGKDSALSTARTELSEAETALVTAEADFSKIKAGVVTAENIEKHEAAIKEVADAKEKLTKAEADAEEKLEALRDKTYSEAEITAVVENLDKDIITAQNNVKAAEENIKKVEEALKVAKNGGNGAADLENAKAALGKAQKKLTEARAAKNLQSKALPREWRGGSYAAYAYTFITTTHRFPAISNAIFGDMGGWRQTAERLFANAYLGGWFESAACDSSFDVNEEGASTAMIEVAPNIYQSAGSIQAERSLEQSYPLLCSLEEESLQPCAVGECRDGVCFQDKTATEPERGYLYKITWSVSAPQDLKFTARQNEGRNQVDFNLQVDDIWLFQSEDGTTPNANTIHLGVGNTSRNLPLPPIIIEYFPDKYEQACIIFGENKPLKNYRAGGGSIEEICTAFKEITESGTVSDLLDETGEPSQTTTNVQYCGLDGKC